MDLPENANLFAMFVLVNGLDQKRVSAVVDRSKD